MKAARKKPGPKVVKTRNGNTMTEAAFRSWVRSGLRRLSMRWKPIYQCKAKAKRDATPEEVALFSKGRGRIRNVYVCALCSSRVPDKQGAVDHKIPAGSLVDIEQDAGPFILRLLVEASGLQWLCDPCHDAKTEAERNAHLPKTEYNK